jgi:MSHA pilin protein MshC
VRAPSVRARRHGFTLVELVVTLLIVGILAVVALPRFADRALFETRGFVDQTLVTLQYARKVAVASGRNVCVAAAAGGNTLAVTMATLRGAAGVCAAANVVANPSASWRTFSGVAYGSALATTFFADGSATATLAPHFTVVGDSSYTIVVEATGYVHCSPVSVCE